jgi:hypothetical protein
VGPARKCRVLTSSTARRRRPQPPRAVGGSNWPLGARGSAHRLSIGSRGARVRVKGEGMLMSIAARAPESAERPCTSHA